MARALIRANSNLRRAEEIVALDLNLDLRQDDVGEQKTDRVLLVLVDVWQRS